MRKFSVPAVKLAQIALGLVLTATLAACGGGDRSDPVPVANTNTTATVNASTVATMLPATPAATPKVFTFANGFAATDGSAGATPVTLSGPTTVAFTGSVAAPTFEISNGGSTAKGTTTFGSCFFTVTESTFPADSPLALGKVVKVNPCNVTASTAGAEADGIPTVRDVILVLGETPSTPIKLNITVNADGSVLIGSNDLGSVTLTLTTGAGS